MNNLTKFNRIKNQLSKLKYDIDSFDTKEKQIPELIDKANLLRQNEFLKVITDKKSLLINAYLSYIEILEHLLLKSNFTIVNTKHKSKKQKFKTINNKKKSKVKRKLTNKQNSKKKLRK